MPSILNITNGDSAVFNMREGHIEGDYLPWRDVLHEGQVPENLSLEALSIVRANVIAGFGWADLETVKQGFKDRDTQIIQHANYDYVRLWFEHDLYDQLQLIQILQWFRQNLDENTALTLICTDQYLGMTDPKDFSDLLQFEQPVSRDQFDLADAAWRAFTAPSPEDWVALLKQDTSALPFLHLAVLRFMEEYPCFSNGLTKTEQICLDILAKGTCGPGELFRGYYDKEPIKFMGDLSFFKIINNLADADNPLVKIHGAEKIEMPSAKGVELEITPLGRDIRASKKHWGDLQTRRCYMGGVELNELNPWCWDNERQVLGRRY